MKLLNIIDDSIIIYLNENYNTNIWYHGSPDVRELEKDGGFTDKTINIIYIDNINRYYELQSKLKSARESGNDDEYFKLLDIVGDLRKEYSMQSPIFFTDKYEVAKTYANPNRAFDYQNAEEHTYKARINDGKTVKINATGDRFRFINVNKVRDGFVSAGVLEDDFNKILSMFNFYLNNKSGIKTDMIAAIGQWLGFNSIDVIGVLDSYNGGNIKSTVKMVFNPKDIEIIG